MAEKTLSDYIEEYIAYIDIKQSTKQSYKKILLAYEAYISNQTSTPNRSDILKYKEYLKENVRAASVQKIHCYYQKLLSMVPHRRLWCKSCRRY